MIEIGPNLAEVIKIMGTGMIIAIVGFFILILLN